MAETGTDSLGFLDAVAGLPEQLAVAHEAAGEITRAAPLPDADSVRNIVVVGMGGSGIAGDVLAAVTNGVVPVPITVLKQYRTPRFVGPGTLAFAVSYSGDTEETLSMAREHWRPAQTSSPFRMAESSPSYRAPSTSRARMA